MGERETMAEDEKNNIEKAREAAEIAAAAAPILAQFGDFIIKLVNSLRGEKK